jgi:hypothetical protein
VFLKQFDFGLERSHRFVVLLFELFI